MNKKKYANIIIIVLILIIILLTLLSLNSKSKINKYSKELASSFYTEFYYDKVTEKMDDNKKKEFFDNYKEVGLKVSFSTMEKYLSKEYKSKFDYLKKHKCEMDKSNSIKIIPKSPYKKNDYSIELDLNCK